MRACLVLMVTGVSLLPAPPATAPAQRVNFSSGIQHVRVDVLVSETTWAKLAEPRRGHKLASADIRGRKEPVVVYTIDTSAATVQITPDVVP